MEISFVLSRCLSSKLFCPFVKYGGNPCSTELGDKKAKFKQIDETSGGEDSKNVIFLYYIPSSRVLVIDPVIMLSCWSILFDTALIEERLAELAVSCCSMSFLSRVVLLTNVMKVTSAVF